VGYILKFRVAFILGGMEYIEFLDGEFFSFFTFFHINFAKIYGPQKNLLYIWRRGGRRQGPTAVPHGGRKTRGTVAP
jgi:hypothetical protein